MTFLPASMFRVR